MLVRGKTNLFTRKKRCMFTWYHKEPVIVENEWKLIAAPTIECSIGCAAWMQWDNFKWCSVHPKQYFTLDTTTSMNNPSRTGVAFFTGPSSLILVKKNVTRRTIYCLLISPYQLWHFEVYVCLECWIRASRDWGFYYAMNQNFSDDRLSEAH